MRKLFAKTVLEEMSVNPNIILITADMGYGLWDDVKNTYPKNFFNVGSAEQLMIGCAGGFALEGKIPICYSITPFAIYRPFEFIRNLMNIEKLPIKIAGGGRDKDYGYLGFTHWAEEDMSILSILHNIKNLKPSKDFSEEILCDLFKITINSPYPSYINLSK
jgi:transketolase